MAALGVVARALIFGFENRSGAWVRRGALYLLNDIFEALPLHSLLMVVRRGACIRPPLVLLLNRSSRVRLSAGLEDVVIDDLL